MELPSNAMQTGKNMRTRCGTVDAERQGKEEGGGGQRTFVAIEETYEEKWGGRGEGLGHHHERWCVGCGYIMCCGGRGHMTLWPGGSQRAGREQRWAYLGRRSGEEGARFVLVSKAQ